MRLYLCSVTKQKYIYQNMPVTIIPVRSEQELTGFVDLPG